jgi:hypothetical protein
VDAGAALPLAGLVPLGVAVPLVFPLVPLSLVGGVVVDPPGVAGAVWSLELVNLVLLDDSTRSATMQSRIQNAAKPIVIFVNRSPALVPNALCPPAPPSAPAKPPPRPRWISTTIISTIAVNDRKNPKNVDMSTPFPLD